MIAKIRGTLDSSSTSHLIISAGSLGYRVFVTPEALSEAKRAAGEISLWTYHAIREESQELFGFFKKEELEFFELLLKVPGVGPKSALSIMSVAPLVTLRRAIGAGDVSYMTKVSGIGKKTAEKVVLELRDKLGSAEEYPEMKGDLDVLEALKSLGYDRHEARKVLSHIPQELTQTNDRVKEALRLLSKNHS
ncbi:MAG TPA: Holliday junction branch migration protein RuvA [Candidatus Paceibacterota bacterium]